MPPVITTIPITWPMVAEHFIDALPIIIAAIFSGLAFVYARKATLTSEENARQINIVHGAVNHLSDLRAQENLAAGISQGIIEGTKTEQDRVSALEISKLTTQGEDKK
jgi:hypothetical protein